MAKKLKQCCLSGVARGEVIISGMFTLGSSGAIASAAGFVPSAAAGVSPGVVKTATKTARYTVTLDQAYASLRFLGAPGIVGPADAAFGNTNANGAEYRNRSAGTGVGPAATPASFDIQLMLDSTGADTDGASGYEVHWAVVVRTF